MMVRTFAKARIERLIRDIGAERVSSDAVIRLNDHLTDVGITISKYAMELAQHSGRKTVKAEDISLGVDKMGYGSPPKIKKGGFAGARVERLIRDAGAFRVSSDAIVRLNDILTTRGSCVAQEAVKQAKHSHRKTIKDDDMSLASKKTHWC